MYDEAEKSWEREENRCKVEDSENYSMRSLKISPYPRSFSFFKFIVHAFHLPAIILSTNKEDIQRTLKQHLEVAPPK